MTTSTLNMNSFNFPDKIVPYFKYNGADYYRLQGIEKLIIGARHLVFSSNAEISKNFQTDGLLLNPGEWIGTGTFRNSFFLDTISQLTKIRNLNFFISYEGALKIKLMCAVLGKPSQVINEFQLVSREPTQYTCPVGSPTDFPEASRIFFHIEALDTGTRIQDICYCTSTPPRQDCRLAVLLRTFGRTVDLKALLKRFSDTATSEIYYETILDNIDFWVLDTTADIASEYNEPWQKKLNLKVFTGPNLGGGGNAGHLLRLFKDACKQSNTPPTELLILDDDLSLSMESIARYFMFCAYRTKDVICSLPILMKSQPSTIWEDGGFWGRLNFQEDGDFGHKRNLFPNLLKHGLRLDGSESIDSFNALNICEYSTFIFFGMSMKAFEKIGYPASFFLRGDDIELSLRAQKSGFTMITSPNLAAWHEPAHSYGQEYMAILHGCIINFTYSDSDADYYCRYFEERYQEHCSINDLTGMALYLSILTELLDPDSLVLTSDFQSHYLAKLKELSSIKTQQIPYSDREKYEKQAHADNTLLIPFVYPGYHKRTDRYKNIVVINHSMKTYRQLPSCSISDKVPIGVKYMEKLAQLEQNFDQVRERWQKRLSNARSREYWCNIRDRYATETNQVTILSRQNVSTKLIVEGPVTDIAISSKIMGWWNQKFKELRSEKHQEALRLDEKLRKEIQTSNDIIHSFATKPIKEVSMLKKLLRGLPRPEKKNSLPSDFDPSVYLMLNKDVADAKVDPVQHYLNHGISEGRKYRLE